MKVSFKQVVAALFVGALLAQPAISPIQLTVHAELDDWDMDAVEAIRKTPSSERRGSGSLPIPESKASGSSAKSSSSSSSGTSTASFDFEPSTAVPGSGLMSKVKSYQKTSDKVIGWLYVPGTNIDEPIVQDPAEANNYYEYRTWDGVYYPNNNWTNFATTATWADRRVKTGSSWGNSSRNTVLYGHNWTNLRNPLDIGTGNNHIMFGQLPSYTDMTFAQNHPYIYYSTAENEGIWKVFAAFYCEDSSAFPYNTPNPSAETFATALQDYKNRSIYDFSTDVNSNDRILTLSTCTRVYGDHGSQRYVVMARLLRDGESDSDSISVSVNTDMKKPLL